MGILLKPPAMVIICVYHCCREKGEVVVDSAAAVLASGSTRRELLRSISELVEKRINDSTCTDGTSVHFLAYKTKFHHLNAVRSWTIS